MKGQSVGVTNNIITVKNIVQPKWLFKKSGLEIMRISHEKNA
jgi:hypothetical protein